MLYCKKIFWINLLVRFPLFFIIPISMFSDGVFRLLPNSIQLYSGNISFYTPPLYMLVQGFYTLFLKGILLEYFWKLTSLISLILIALVVFPKISSRLNLNKEENIISYILLLFSTWSLLFGAAVQIEMFLTLLTLSAFLVLISALKSPSSKNIFFLVLFIALMVYTKQTSFFYIAGFGLYALASKVKPRNKILVIVALIIGVLLLFPWYLKNLSVYGSDNLLIGILGEADSASDVARSGKFIEFGKIDYLDQAIKSYHYFWEIPLSEKANLGFFFNIYHYLAIFVTLIITLFIVLGIIKYGKEHLSLLLLILPSLFFSLIYWNYLTFYQFQDVGRHTFPIHIFLYIFAAKFISGLKNINLKKLSYLIIAGFVILSIVSAYGISWNIYGKDKELREISILIKDYNGKIKTDYIFSEVALEFYAKKSRADILPDNSISCEDNIIYSKSYFKVSKDSEIRICSL